MLLALLIFRLTVNEPKFVAEMQADSKRFGIDNGDDGDTPAASGKLGKAERRSLIFCCCRSCCGSSATTP